MGSGSINADSFFDGIICGLIMDKHHENDNDWTKRSALSMFLELLAILAFCIVVFILGCYVLVLLGANGSGRLPWAP